MKRLKGLKTMDHLPYSGQRSRVCSPVPKKSSAGSALGESQNQPANFQSLDQDWATLEAPWGSAQSTGLVKESSECPSPWWFSALRNSTQSPGCQLTTWGPGARLWWYSECAERLLQEALSGSTSSWCIYTKRETHMRFRLHTYFSLSTYFEGFDGTKKSKLYNSMRTIHQENEGLTKGKQTQWFYPRTEI